MSKLSRRALFGAAAAAAVVPSLDKVLPAAPSMLLPAANEVVWYFPNKIYFNQGQRFYTWSELDGSWESWDAI